MIEPELIISRDEGIVALRLNRPQRRNAITVSMMKALQRAIEDAGEDRSARVIVISASGDRAFCAGADLAPDATPFQPGSVEPTLPFANLLRTGRASRIPIISAVNGACVAGGMGILGISDVVVAAPHARFGLTEVKVGLFPMQILAVLRDLIPSRLMADMCFTGRLIDAEEALAAGLVNRIVEPGSFDAAVRKLAEDICAVSPTAIRRGKYALTNMASMTFEQMIAFGETQIGPMLMTADAKEGLLAFNERRAPVWPNA